MVPTLFGVMEDGTPPTTLASLKPLLKGEDIS